MDNGKNLNFTTQTMKTLVLLSESELLKLCVSALGSLGAKMHVSTTVNTVWELYGKPGRDYHGKLHILHTISWVVANITSNPALNISKPRLIIALFYHDAICVPGSTKNEEESREMMVRDLTRMGVLDAEIKQIAVDILDTKHQTEPETEEGKCMVDADISGFALPIEDVWADTGKLFKESGKDVPIFAKCTTAFLQMLLSRSRIYYSLHMSEAESVARTNILELVERLGDVVTGQRHMVVA